MLNFCLLHYLVSSYSEAMTLHKVDIDGENSVQISIVAKNTRMTPNYNYGSKQTICYFYFSSLFSYYLINIIKKTGVALFYSLNVA